MREKYNKETFIAKARLIHGDKYDYSKVEYVKSIQHVTITCPIHGDFLKRPDAHLRGQGCPKCAFQKIGAANRKSVADFINKANEAHGFKYDYSKVVYVGCQRKVCIICPIHGEFWQIPLDHARGIGCPFCGKDKVRKLIHGVAKNDVINCEQSKAYKVWQGMIDRCYGPKSKAAKNYKFSGVTVCEEWLSFSNFKLWFENPANGYIDGYQLDKDILVHGNKIYSPETCCFVPVEINSIFRRIPKRQKHIYPMGVMMYGKKFGASISINNRHRRLGLFNTPLEAFQAYKNAKENHVKELAEKYFKDCKITQKVYDALMKYKVTA